MPNTLNQQGSGSGRRIPGAAREAGWVAGSAPSPCLAFLENPSLSTPLCFLFMFPLPAGAAGNLIFQKFSFKNTYSVPFSSGFISVFFLCVAEVVLCITHQFHVLYFPPRTLSTFSSVITMDVFLWLPGIFSSPWLTQLGHRWPSSTFSWFFSLFFSYGDVSVQAFQISLVLAFQVSWLTVGRGGMLTS